ncbi:MAG: AhpC/TSA family protein [Paludibacter sp.]|nr:AhpC/TSA family protein [Paludibacter sp.]
MNKTLILLFVAFILIVGCTKNKFSIEGTLQDTAKYNGKTVYLNDQNYVSFDSTVIKDGKFSISTVCDSSRIAFLTIEITPYNSPEVIPFVFETGKVQLEITNNDFILSGTPQNVTLQQFAETESNLWKKLGNYKSQLQSDSTMADSSRILLTSQMEDLVNQEYGEKSFELVKQNANNPIGKYIFLKTYYYYDPLMIDEAIGLMDEKTKNTEKIKRIMENNELTKSLSNGANYIDFKALTQDGDTLTLSNLVGKTDYMLLDFWASWCPDCMAAMPALKQIYEKNKGKLEILGISLDDDKEKWIKNGIEKFNLQWKQVSNLAYWDDNIAKKYAVSSIPSIFLIDKNGKIIAAKTTLSHVRAIISETK